MKTYGRYVVMTSVATWEVMILVPSFNVRNVGKKLLGRVLHRKSKKLHKYQGYFTMSHMNKNLTVRLL